MAWILPDRRWGFFFLVNKYFLLEIQPLIEKTWWEPHFQAKVSCWGYPGFCSPFCLNSSLLLVSSKEWADGLALRRVLLVMPFRKLLTYTTERIYTHFTALSYLKINLEDTSRVRELCKARDERGSREKGFIFLRGLTRYVLIPYTASTNKRLKSYLFVLKCFKRTRRNKLLTHPIWPSVRWHLLPISTSNPGGWKQQEANPSSW